LEEIRVNFAHHGLMLNSKKTNIVQFHNSVKKVDDWSITIANEEIKPVPFAKFLGVSVHETLKWNEHILNLQFKLQGSLFVIRRLSTITSKEVSIQAYHALIMSHLNYGILAWGSTSKCHLTNVLKLQKKGIRYIQGLSYRDSCRNHFKILKIFTAPSLYIFKCIVYFIRNSKERNLQRNGDTHAYNTKSKGKFLEPRLRTKLASNQPFYQGLRFFQALPLQLKITSESNPKIFNKQLKEFLIDKVFYSLDEYLE